MANTLFDFYKAQGQALPSLQQRQSVAKEAGIQNYSGTAQQNEQLLGFLKAPSRAPVAPIQSQNTAITPASLAPAVPVNVPTPSPTPAPVVPVNIADQILKDTEVKPTETQQFQESTISKVLSNIGMLSGEQADLSKALNESGITTLKQDLQGINSQILKKQAEVQQDDIQLVANMRAEERRDTLLPFAQQGQAKLAGDASIMRALKTSEIGVLSALAIGKQGDIALAKQTAEEAVNAKYAPYKEQNAIYKAQLEAIAPLLSKDEKKQAREQDLRVDLALKEIDKAEQTEKSIQTLKLDIIQNGGNPSILDKATTIDEAIKLGASALKKPNNEIRELNGSLYMIDKDTGKSKLITGGGNGNNSTIINTPINKPIVDSINTILGSGKFTKDQATAVRNAINNGEDPLVVIKNNAKNIMGQTEATALGKYETAKQSMTDLDNSLKQFYANEGTTDIFKGNYEKVINKLGKVNDPKLVELAVQIQTNLQVYRNAVSGTAYSVQEGKDIASIFPGINKTQGLNQAIISGRQKAFDSTIDATYKNVLGSNYDKLKNGQAGIIPKSGMSDKDYVEKVLVSKNIKYDEFVNNVPTGQIPVIDNETGKTGYIPYLEFNSSKYTKI